MDRGMVQPERISTDSQPSSAAPCSGAPLPFRPRLLDLFCGVGGAGMGYHRAGFDVTGVDIKPQKRYPFRFIQADALEYCRDHGHEYDAIHASPPCQAFSAMKSLHNAKKHEDLVTPLRPILEAVGKPYVMENVPGAPLVNPVIMCGSMFALRSDRGYLQRHRLFEINVLGDGSRDLFFLLPPCHHKGLAIGVYGHGQAGHLGQKMRTAKAAEARQLMGMDWSHRDGMSQAIPPAYTEFIGKQLLSFLGAQ
jgi:DNA (cytosine-5)-methyltransferase 1